MPTLQVVFNDKSIELLISEVFRAINISATPTQLVISHNGHEKYVNVPIRRLCFFHSIIFPNFLKHFSIELFCCHRIYLKEQTEKNEEIRLPSGRIFAARHFANRHAWH